jgi:hypothetical protein
MRNDKYDIKTCEYIQKIIYGLITTVICPKTNKLVEINTNNLKLCKIKILHNIYIGLIAHKLYNNETIFIKIGNISIY